MTAGAPSKPKKGSINDHLSRLEVGEAVWFDTTDTAYPILQRQATTRSRFPASMAHMEFVSQVFTCVSAKTVGDVRVAVRIERVA